MCFTANFNGKEITAKRDIHIPKLFHKWHIEGKIKYASLCLSFMYQFNKVYKTELDIIRKKEPDNNNYIYIEQGYHGYTKICRNMLYWEFDIGLDCIIPAGSKYWVNKKFEIVSNSIIVTDKELFTKEQLKKKYNKLIWGRNV